jgi:recombinational DNA repair ATPase RecF
MSATVPYDRLACAQALQASAALYRKLRQQLASVALTVRTEAEKAALSYLNDIKKSIREAEKETSQIGPHKKWALFVEK